MPHLNMWLDYGIYSNSDLLMTFTTTAKVVLTTTKLATAGMSADGLGQAIDTNYSIYIFLAWCHECFQTCSCGRGSYNYVLYMVHQI